MQKRHSVWTIKISSRTLELRGVYFLFSIKRGFPAVTAADHVAGMVVAQYKISDPMDKLVRYTSEPLSSILCVFI